MDEIGPNPSRATSFRELESNMESLRMQSSEDLSDDEKLAMHFVNQVEAMVAAGPGGKLNEYLSVVDLLFNAKVLFEQNGHRDGLLQTQELLSTAMEDLEFEFKRILEQRSQQAVTRITKERLREIPPSGSIFEATADVTRFSDHGSQSSQTGSPPGSPRSSLNLKQIEFLPGATVRWLNQIALKMELGGCGQNCAYAYGSYRAGVLKTLLDILELSILENDTIAAMDWPHQEKAMKTWIQDVYAIVGVLLKGERELCSRVFSELSDLENIALIQIMKGRVFQILKSYICMAQELASKKSAEQLFVTLEMFAVVEELQFEVRLSFSSIEIIEISLDFDSLPIQLSQSILATFDTIKELLAEGTTSANATSSNANLSKRKLFYRVWKGGKEEHNDAILADIPPGGDVHPLTSYMVNYIRGYLSRRGRRNYVVVLERVLNEYGNSRGQLRSIEQETAQLVLALRRNLEAKAKLCPDEAMQELFLMNNVNYVYRSMLAWHGWHGQGFLRALSTARREGARDVLLTLSDLQDDRIVEHHALGFQNRALDKVLSYLVQEYSTGNAFFGGKDGLSELKSRLKKFNAAFEELCSKQRGWKIPDADLATRVRSKWGLLLKERYRKATLPYLEEISSSRSYCFTPEALEQKVLNTFFKE